MRFPSVTSFRPTRPPTGADTCVNSTSSLAASTAASASSTDASACRTFDSRMSASSCEMAWLASRSLARAKFFRASASRDFASSASASARCSAASYGRGSIKKRRSPFLTIAPSRKWIDCRYPLTRGRTSTESTASRRAVYSSHSVISRATGWTTVTFGGGGVGAGRARRAERRVQHGAALGHVDLLAAEHRLDARPQARLLGQCEEEPNRLVRHPVLRVVEVQPRGFGGVALAPLRVVGEERPEVHVPH